MKFIKDNAALSGLAGFFLFIGICSNFENSKYRETLPIIFENNFSAKEKQIIRKSIRWHLMCWQLDFQKPTKFAKIHVVRNPFKREVIFGSQNNETLWGLCDPFRRKITVYVGECLEIPSLYHELCHLNIDPTNNHEGARWKKWKLRGAKISLWLKADNIGTIYNLE
jgi:hypothetical protein